MNKLSKVLLTIVIFLLIVIFFLIAQLPKNNEEEKYDPSFMNEVTVSEILDLFASEKTYVVYVGRSTCDVCKRILPALQEAQIANNYITQYLDIESADRTSDEWSELVSKLSMKSTQTLTEDGTGEKVTETYGYFLDQYGFTPTIIVIKDGKQVAGFIGGANHDELVNWLTSKVN